MKPLADSELLQTYLDGDLAHADIVALEKRLVAEPPLADLLLSLAREEAILTEWARTQAVTVETGNPVELCERVACACASQVPMRSGPHRWLRTGVWVTVAAALVLALLNSLTVPRPSSPSLPEPAAFAKLEDAQGEVFVVPELGGEPVRAQRGQMLKPGQSLTTRGEGSFAVVALADARRVELGTDTTVRLDSPPTASDTGAKLYLEEGTVAPDVAKQREDRPMILSTPHAEFLIRPESRANITSGSRGTRVEQEKGKSQMVNRKDGSSVDVPTGWFAVVSAQGGAQVAPQPMAPTITQPRAVLRDGIGPFLSAAYSPDASLLALGCPDGTFKLLNLTANQLEIAPVKTGKAPVRAIAYSPNGNLLAVTADDRLVKLFALPSGMELAVLKKAKTNITCMVFSADGSLLATGGGGRSPEIKVWSVDARLELANLTGHTNAIQSLAFAPDGRTLASASRDGTVKLWDLSIGKERLALAAHLSQVNTVAFSPDGGSLVTAGKDLTVKVWDPATGAERHVFQGFTGEVRSVALSPDGKKLAAADSNVRLWDLTTGQQLLTYRGNKNNVCSMKFTADGRQLITAGFDRTIRVWDVPGEAPAGPNR